MTSTNGHVRQVRIDELEPGPWQPRRVFEEASLSELAASIKAQGVLTPLRVVRGSDAGRYLIIAGERRWRAASRAGITDVPCFVVERRDGESEFRELAIVDNLHRANLQPGEEARAVGELYRLGLKQREIGIRLGKSAAWVGQRLAIARLPGAALDRLDSGSITREDAIALTRLIHRPDLVEACLEPTGLTLRTHVVGHVPDGIGERAIAVLRSLELERLRETWSAKMRAEGHRVLDEPPRENDRRYVRLMHGSEIARAHQSAGLSCEAWAWEHGQTIRVCTEPTRLRQAATFGRPDALEEARVQERHRVAAREAARDGVVRAWLATSRNVESSELALLARERIRTLTSRDEGLLVRLGEWLGVSGDRAAIIDAAEQELATVGERRLLQLWFALECAHGMTQTAIPPWTAPWLERLGFVDRNGT